MPATQKHRFLAIETALGADKLLLQDFSMNDALGRLFQMEAELRSDDRDIKFEDIVGTQATVRLELPGGKGTRYFNGCISRFVQVEHQGSYAVYRAMLVPWMWFLTRTADCRIFQNKKVPDIIEEVFKGHGLTDYKLKLTGSYDPWEFCVQYRETDFNFVSRLMEQEGIYYYFEHQNGVHTLILADSSSAHEPYKGYDTLTYRPPTTRQEESTETVTEWTIEKEVQPGQYALNDFNFTTPKTSLLANANIGRQHQQADFEVYDYPGEYEQRSEGDTYAKVRIEELQTQFETLRAQATVRGVCTGCKFTLQGNPREDQNRAYLVTSTSIHVKAGEYESGKGSEGEFYHCRFTAMPLDSKCPFRPERLTPKPLIQGPQTAIVVGPSGEEIYTEQYGRVKVQFPWDRYGKSDENSSCWVRVSHPWAGKTWGMVAIPRMGQEVIVEFLEGDPDRPIITGRVYNADQTTPYDLPANKTQTGVKTRSSKGGSSENYNEIRFEDKKGSEQISIHAEKDQQIAVENDETTSVGHDRTETVGNNEQITIGKNRTEQVAGNETISIGQSRTRNVAQNENVTVGIARTHSVGANEAINVGAAQEINVGAAQTISVGAAQAVSVGDKRDTSVGGNDSLSVGKKLSIEAGDEITIKTGDASIEMKKDGTITISGKDITLKGSGNISVKASSNVTIKGSKVSAN